MPPEPLGHIPIKKYSNRRFYDASRSRHVTLADLHDLICQGYNLTVTDSATGEDITNLVLTQIIVEHDPPKLDFFPSSILHNVIRTQHQMLGTVFEQFVRQMVEAQRSSQQQWARFLQNTLGMNAWMPGDPMGFTQAMMNAFRPFTPGPSQPENAPSESNRDQELETLRRQVAELSRRVEDLSGGKP